MSSVPTLTLASSGNVAISGPIAFLGTVSMLQPPVSLSMPGNNGESSYSVDTDGLFVGFIEASLWNAWGSLTVTCTPPAGVADQFQGTAIASDMWQVAMTCSLVLPVPSGSTFTIQPQGTAAGWSGTAYFFPFGAGTATLQTG